MDVQLPQEPTPPSKIQQPPRNRRPFCGRAHTILSSGDSADEPASDAQWTAQVKNTLFTTVPARLARPTIFTVPKDLLRQDRSSYRPQIISFGPSYVDLDWYDISKCLSRYKLRCVRFLLSRHRCEDEAGELLTRCLLKLAEFSSEIRGCYSHEIKMDDRELTEIMLHDGCFIIRYLLKQAEQEDAEEEPEQQDEEEQLLSMPWIWKLVDRDLLKLENQIPFFVIEALFELLRTKDDAGILLVDLALKLFRKIRPAKLASFKPRGDYFHLLHLFYCSLLPPDHETRSKKITKAIERATHDEISHEWLPSATDLQRTGIKLKKKLASSSFLGVTFNCGALEIPSLYLMDYTGSIFRNLIAFELLVPRTQRHVVAYVAFMHCILNKDRDVAMLRSNGILVSSLNSEEAAIKLFDELADPVHYDSDASYLRDIFVKVNEYHRAGLMGNDFEIPWTKISLIAAILLPLVVFFASLFTSHE